MAKAKSKKEDKIKEILGETKPIKAEELTRGNIEEVPTYYTVGKLRDVLKNLDDNVPVVAAPLSENIRTALNLFISEETQLESLGYKGKVAIFSVGLFDIATNKEIVLTPEKKEDVQQ